MIVTTDAHARPCPGVTQAISKTEEKLRQGENIITAGELIHNRREVARLEELGLQYVTPGEVDALAKKKALKDHTFLVRAHGEKEEILKKSDQYGMKNLDATCPIVRHSQKIVDTHVKEGWGIVIVGKKNHPEVVGIESRARGSIKVISTLKETEQDFDNRTLLIAQTTIDPALFNKVRTRLFKKIPRLKVVDTTCRYLRKRQKSMREFAAAHDVIIHVGGKNSSNGKLLHETSLQVNKRSYRVESCDEVNPEWFREGDSVGVTGYASTPRWQLEEMHYYLEHLKLDENPKGLKNRKGGTFLWWPRKKTRTKK